jgi:hypothetical protein
VSEVVVVEIHRKPARIKVIQSPNAIITTIGMETVVAPARIMKCYITTI